MLYRIGRIIDIWGSTALILTLIGLSLLYIRARVNGGDLSAVWAVAALVGPWAIVIFLAGKSARYIFTDPAATDRAGLDRKLAVDEAYRKGVSAGEYFRARDEHIELDRATATVERGGVREGVREALHAVFAIHKPSSFDAVDVLRPEIARIVCSLPCIPDDERVELIDQVIDDLKCSLANGRLAETLKTLRM